MKSHILPFLGGKRGRYSYEKKCQYALKSGEIKILPQPRPIEDEVVVLATRLSEVFLSNSTYPKNYFENIASLCRVKMVRKLYYLILWVFILLNDKVKIISIRKIYLLLVERKMK